MKPICVACGLFFTARKNGFPFIEGMPDGRLNFSNGLRSGKDSWGWKPYKLWVGDLWECRGCGAQIISGFGDRPISEHYMPDFEITVRKFNVEFQVNDC